MTVESIRAVNIGDETGERERPALEVRVDALCADIYSDDPAVIAATDAALAAPIRAAIRASGIGAPA